MRQKVQQQMPLVHQPIEHEHARELDLISHLLDDDPAIVDLVFADIKGEKIDPETGRKGMTAEQVLRAIIIKQMNGYSYETLAFHLADSSTYRRFCRIGIADDVPKKSTLQRNIKRVRPETLEALNRLLVRRARTEGIEPGDKVRVDCTVTESNIHEPSDSSLLWDCVRVLVRLMLRVDELVGYRFPNRSLRARRRALDIDTAKNARQRRKHYRDLLMVTVETVDLAENSITVLASRAGLGAMEGVVADGLVIELRHFIDLSHRVVDQTRRRVIDGEKVPAQDKVVSIFEPHTDIIVKARRETQFGHKLCLSAGASGMVLDCVIQDGNPADSTLAVGMVERHEAILGRLPRQAAFDGGFASKANLKAIKAMGVKDVAFHKRRGIKVSDMVKSSWVFRRLRNFRAGIEGIISFMKRAVGLRRCTWRSLGSFKAYTWSSILTANLLVLARHLLL